MLQVSEKEVITRFHLDNPWWDNSDGFHADMNSKPRRAYLEAFYSLITDQTVRRAVILMGPRRVGKTVMCHQAIHRLIKSGVNPKTILYLSIDTPIYSGTALEKLLSIFKELHHHSNDAELYVFYDEVQYLKDWEVHLKSIVDAYKSVKFIASGSAAAALKLKSNESGAGRFTDYMLPPLTFSEFLDFIGKGSLVDVSHLDKAHNTDKFAKTSDIEQLNKLFIDYLNYGGYPEAVLSESIRNDPARYIRSDIIDKVLLRDLPSLYGINDIQELNKLFATLAYNTGQEISYESLSKSSGIAKNTIKRYIEYLEAAFLIAIVHRIDENSKSFKRTRTMKVYLTNPSMRSALFEPITSDHESMGSVVETAIYSQWMHSDSIKHLHYSRWKNGEVDIVYIHPSNMKPVWIVEVKWSNRYFNKPHELNSLIHFCKLNDLTEASVTTINLAGIKNCHDVEIEYHPSSIYCYTVGRNITRIEPMKRLQNDETGLPTL